MPGIQAYFITRVKAVVTFAGSNGIQSYLVKTNLVSSSRFIANQVGLWPFILAYHLSNFVISFSLLESIIR